MNAEELTKKYFEKLDLFKYEMKEKSIPYKYQKKVFPIYFDTGGINVSKEKFTMDQLNIISRQIKISYDLEWKYFYEDYNLDYIDVKDLYSKLKNPPPYPTNADEITKKEYKNLLLKLYKEQFLSYLGTEIFLEKVRIHN